MIERQVFHSGTGANLTVSPHRLAPSVATLTTSSYAWHSSDIKELRKFLKKLQKQLEGETGE